MASNRRFFKPLQTLMPSLRERMRRTCSGGTTTTSDSLSDAFQQNLATTFDSRQSSKHPRQGADNGASPLPTTEPSWELAVKPGKKRLRKMRYIQRTRPKTELFQVSAENALFTKSVRIYGPWVNDDSNGDSQLFDASSASTVTVHTSSESPDPARSPPSLLQIHVQSLLILDLNGILCHRVRNDRGGGIGGDPCFYRESVGVVARTPVIPRPHASDWLYYLDRHFCLSVWTSAKATTAKTILERVVPSEIIGRLLFVWDQSHCKMVPAENKTDAPLFQKDLSLVWQAYPLWSTHSTLLIDDSPEKCEAWSENAFHPPPLNGRLSPEHGLIDDEVNVRNQDDFFSALVDHWRRHPVVATVDDECGDTVYSVTKSQGDFIREYWRHR